MAVFAILLKNDDSSPLVRTWPLASVKSYNHPEMPNLGYDGGIIFLRGGDESGTESSDAVSENSLGD